MPPNLDAISPTALKALLSRALSMDAIKSGPKALIAETAERIFFVSS
nr:MAG TPA: hypothetical protein [Bacteriophage sp.]